MEANEDQPPVATITIKPTGATVRKGHDGCAEIEAEVTEIQRPGETPRRINARIVIGVQKPEESGT